MAGYRSTEEFAQDLKVKPGTIRRALCVNGHYMGVRPVKLPNHRLLWPAVEIEKLSVERIVCSESGQQ